MNSLILYIVRYNKLFSDVLALYEINLIVLKNYRSLLLEYHYQGSCNLEDCL